MFVNLMHQQPFFTVVLQNKNVLQKCVGSLDPPLEFGPSLNMAHPKAVQIGSNSLIDHFVPSGAS